MSRQPRAQVIQGERRRRRAGTLDGLEDMRLALPQECRDDRTHVYRWVNDEGYRVNSLYNRDWDTVTLSANTGKPEDELRRQVDVKDGKPVYAILMRKPVELHKEDRAAMIQSTETREDALLEAPERGSGDDSPTESDKTYVVKGSRINRRGAYAP